METLPRNVSHAHSSGQLGDCCRAAAAAARWLLLLLLLLLLLMMMMMMMMMLMIVMMLLLLLGTVPGQASSRHTVVSMLKAQHFGHRRLRHARSPAQAREVLRGKPPRAQLSQQHVGRAVRRRHAGWRGPGVGGAGRRADPAWSLARRREQRPRAGAAATRRRRRRVQGVEYGTTVGRAAMRRARERAEVTDAFTVCHH